MDEFDWSKGFEGINRPKVVVITWIAEKLIDAIFLGCLGLGQVLGWIEDAKARIRTRQPDVR